MMSRASNLVRRTRYLESRSAACQDLERAGGREGPGQMLGIDEKKIDGIPAQRTRNRENVSSPVRRWLAVSNCYCLEDRVQKAPASLHRQSIRDSIVCDRVWETDMPSKVVLCNGGYL